MPTSPLLDNLNSDWMSAFSVLLPKTAPIRVLVYVESDEDIAFWRNVLNPFEEEGISFDIQLPVKNALEKGKKAALNKSSEIMNIATGTHLIICVDSDYDYLLQGATEVSEKINNSDFIFQTYAYSIENLHCFSGSLHGLCVQATKNDNKLIDLPALLNLYSRIIYKLLLWSVYLEKKGDHQSFTISDFCDKVKILDKADIRDQCKTAMEGLQNRVSIKLKELEETFPVDIPLVERLGVELKPLGLDENNAYLFAQGHLIKDNVVLMFLKPLCSELKKEKEAEIKNKAKDKTQDDNLKYYQKQVFLIETVLNHNTEYKSCFLFLKLKEDLSKYVDNLKSAIR